MLDDFNQATATAIDPELLGAHLWGEIQDLFVDQANAEQVDDADDAARIEQAFRRIALAYTTLQVDAQTVTTGRKAIIRSVVARLGSDEVVDLLAILDAVIRREEESRATPRRPASHRACRRGRRECPRTAVIGDRSGPTSCRPVETTSRQGIYRRDTVDAARSAGQVMARAP